LKFSDPKPRYIENTLDCLVKARLLDQAIPMRLD